MASPQRELCGLHLLPSPQARRLARFEMSGRESVLRFFEAAVYIDNIIK